MIAFKEADIPEGLTPNQMDVLFMFLDEDPAESVKAEAGSKVVPLNAGGCCGSQHSGQKGSGGCGCGGGGKSQKPTSTPKPPKK